MQYLFKICAIIFCYLYIIYVYVIILVTDYITTGTQQIDTVMLMDLLMETDDKYILPIYNSCSRLYGYTSF